LRDALFDRHGFGTAGRRHMHGNHILRLYARIGALQIQEGAHQQSGAREQHECHRDFRHHQPVTHRRGGAARCQLA
jgi:hypothetical protein